MLWTISLTGDDQFGGPGIGGPEAGTFPLGAPPRLSGDEVGTDEDRKHRKRKRKEHKKRKRDGKDKVYVNIIRP